MPTHPLFEGNLPKTFEHPALSFVSDFYMLFLWASGRLPSELARLFGVWDDTMLIRNDPLLDPTPDLVAEIQRRLAGVGRYDGEVSGAYDAPTRAALDDWAGWYNLEGRLREDDRLSQHLLSELRDVTPEIT